MFVKSFSPAQDDTSVRVDQFCICWATGDGEESGRASHDAHLNDDETVVKMGHPDLWRVRNRQQQIPVE
jgi:hypothetical protein